MADYFGNGFWAVRYFPAGYWGLDGDVPQRDITASITAQASVTASLSYTSTVPASTGGGKVKKPRRVLSWPRFEPVHVVTFRHGAAHVSGASALSARVTATANGAAHIGGASAVKANATVLRIYTQDAEFWLMAA